MPNYFMFRNFSAKPHRSDEKLAWFLDGKNMPDTLRRVLVNDGPYDFEESREELRAIVEDRLGELRRREEQLRTGIEEPGRAGAGARAMLLGVPGTK